MASRLNQDEAKRTAQQGRQGFSAEQLQKRQEFDYQQQQDRLAARQVRTEKLHDDFDKKLKEYNDVLHKKRHDIDTHNNSLKQGDPAEKRVELPIPDILKNDDTMEDESFNLAVRHYQRLGKEDSLPDYVKNKLQQRQQPKTRETAPGVHVDNSETGPGAAAPAPTRAQRRAEVAQAIRDAIGLPAAPEPAAAPVSGQQPSKVANAARIDDLRQDINSYQQQSQLFHRYTPEGVALYNMEFQLRRAQAQGRGLNLAERAEYEKHLGSLSAELRERFKIPKD
jgi:hypothetical protein